MYEQGVAPILAALSALALAPQTAEAAEASRVATGYFTTHAARMYHPRFVARQFPVGSGAVESACKVLVAARAKGAGMRWSPAGTQALATLRAVQRSGRWERFWQTQPQRRAPYLRRHPRPLAPPRPSPHRAAPKREAAPPCPCRSRGPTRQRSVPGPHRSATSTPSSRHAPAPREFTFVGYTSDRRPAVNVPSVDIRRLLMYAGRANQSIQQRMD